MPFISRHTEETYNKGSKVLYTSRGITTEAVIRDIHYDDALKPYYTIHILDEDREKQTDEDHITSIHQEPQDWYLNNATTYPVQQRRDSSTYPIQERRQGDFNCEFSHTEVFDNEEDSAREIRMSDVDPISYASDLPLRLQNTQATLKSILRPSSYGDISRKDCVGKIDDNDTSSTGLSTNEPADLKPYEYDFNDTQGANNENGSLTKSEYEKKRRLDSESEAKAPKRVRLDPKYASCDRTRSNRNAVKNKSVHRGSRPRQRKAPSLLRPPIDKRYFMRIKKKQRPRRKSSQMTDKGVQTSYISKLNDDIFPSDRDDTPGANAFNSSSILYKEITAKARHLRRAKQHQKSLKRWEDLGEMDII